MKKYISGFTLVELIVVITIIGILSTIGFLSYSNYLSGARDGNRISQMTKLSDALQVYSAKKSLPLPENKIDITASGTIIGYQGELGTETLEILDYTNGGLDPKDKIPFTYYVTSNRKKMQLLAFMEEAQGASANLIGQSYAVNYDKRFPKVLGAKLGVLISSEASTLNTPAQEIAANKSSGRLDVVLTGSGYTAILDENKSITGTGASLRGSIANASCKRIKETGGTRGNGVYTINPGGLGEVQVYCDMETGGTPFIKYFQNENELVAGYNFENILQDFSKNLNHGMMTSGSGVYTPGLQGSAILFSGGPYMSVPNSPSLNFTTNQYTLSFWVNFTVELSAQAQEWPNIIDKRPWCTAGYIFHFGRTWNDASNHICEGGTIKSAILSNLPSLASKWTHFTGTFDGSSFKIFMNGTQMVSNTYANPILNQSSMNMNIGSDYQGMLDSLRIYNRALSDREIQALYREGL